MKTSREQKDSIYVIAEIASTHEGDYEYLSRLVSAASKTGADAVKFQIYRAEEILDVRHQDFALIRSYELDEDEWTGIIRGACELGLEVWVDLSCAYSMKIIESNKNCITGVKLHAADINNSIDLIRYINATKLSVILSCGGTTLIELFDVLNRLQQDDRAIVLMHGFQSYPTAIENSHILRIQKLRETFPFPIGLADHVDGGDDFAKLIPLLAVGMGARVIEKHITLDRKEKRDDYFSSLSPEDFTGMVRTIRTAERALGSERFAFSEAENTYRLSMKKRIVAKRDCKEGESLQEKDIRCIQISDMKQPSSITHVLGMPLLNPVAKGKVFTHSDLVHSVGIFVNARLHSTRLPRKALLPLYNGLTTVEYLLKRLQSYPNLPGRIVFATSTEPEDSPLIECASKAGVDTFRGDPVDVMKRMLQVSEHFGFDTIVRVTGDDILVSAEYIEKALVFHFENNLEYTRIAGLAYGAECEVIDSRALSLIHRYVVRKNQTEYLTWFIDSDGICKTAVMQAAEKDARPHYRLTLDYKEDYLLMKDLAESCHSKIDQFYIPLALINDYLDHTSLNVPNTEEWQKLSRENIDTSLRYGRDAQ